MKMKFGQSTHLTFIATVCLCILAAVTAFAAPAKNKVANGQKTKITAVIIVRDGDLVTVKDKKDGSTQTVAVTGQTKIERERSVQPFHKDVGVNELVPGLAVKVKGVRNAEGQLEAKTISFKPDAFAVTVAHDQQIKDNQAAAKHAQESANEGIANAAGAQKSADQAQSTANQGVSTAEAAGKLAATNAVEVNKVNQRVSDLSQYYAVAQTEVLFPENGHKLNAASKAALDELVSTNSNLEGYVVEITGYTSSTGSSHYNQRLSEQRAAAVAQYLREQGNVPAWRIAVPAGYGETHPVADNSGRDGRAKNRRVEVKVLVSKGSQQSTQVSSVQ